MGDYLDAWRDFLRDLMSHLAVDKEENPKVDTLQEDFEVLYESSNKWGLSRLEFLALIFVICKDFFCRPISLFQALIYRKHFPKKQLTYCHNT